MDKKTEALKLALEALDELKYIDCSHAADDIYYEAITAINEALAEQPAQQQEPVAWMWKDGTVTADPDRADGTWTPLYKSPQPSKPLTKDKTMELANKTAGQYWMDEAHIQRFRSAVEAAHGIK